MSIPPPPKAKESKVRAIYAYTPQTETELGFDEGDIIFVTDKNPDYEGWWYGELRDEGREGFFPSSYVEAVAQVSGYQGKTSVKKSEKIQSLTQQLLESGGGIFDNAVEELHEDYAALQASLQAVSNPANDQQLKALRKEVLDLKKQILTDAQTRQDLKDQIVALKAALDPDAAGDSDPQAGLQALQQEITELKKQNEQLTQQVNTKETQCNEALDANFEQTEKLDQLTAELEQLKHELEKVELKEKVSKEAHSENGDVDDSVLNELLSLRKQNAELSVLRKQNAELSAQSAAKEAQLAQLQETPQSQSSQPAPVDTPPSPIEVEVPNDDHSKQIENLNEKIASQEKLIEALQKLSKSEPTQDLAPSPSGTSKSKRASIGPDDKRLKAHARENSAKKEDKKAEKADNSTKKEDKKAEKADKLKDEKIQKLLQDVQDANEKYLKVMKLLDAERAQRDQIIKAEKKKEKEQPKDKKKKSLFGGNKEEINSLEAELKNYEMLTQKLAADREQLVLMNRALIQQVNQLIKDGGKMGPIAAGPKGPPIVGPSPSGRYQTPPPAVGKSPAARAPPSSPAKPPQPSTTHLKEPTHEPDHHQTKTSYFVLVFPDSLIKNLHYHTQTLVLKSIQKECEKHSLSMDAIVLYNHEGKPLVLKEGTTMEEIPHHIVYLCKEGTAWSPKPFSIERSLSQIELETKKTHRKSAKLDKVTLEAPDAKDKKSKK